MKIGCHLSISKGFLEAAKQIVEIGGNTYQYFSRSPQGGSVVKAWNDADFEDYQAYAKEHNIEELLCHAPYTMNLCSAKESTREFGIMILKDDLKRLEHFQNGLYNIHPGSHTGMGPELAIPLIVSALNESISKNQKTIVLLETMAGKGSEVGRTFEELAAIIHQVIDKEKIGVCLDTCHVYSAGYDIVNHLDDVLEEFDRIIGLDKLKAIHLNDSKMDFGSFKDRHEKIGQGVLGLNTFIQIINHPKLKHLPFYLETPNEMSGYKEEIALLKEHLLSI